MDDGERLTPTERGTLALWLLMQRPHSVQEIASWLNMSWSGAYKVLNRMSRVVPLVFVDGLWYVAREGQKEAPACGPGLDDERAD